MTLGLYDSRLVTSYFSIFYIDSYSEIIKYIDMIKKFARFMKPYKKQFILAICCVVLESMLEVSLPFLMNVLLKNGINTIDDVTYTMDLNYILIIGSIMVGISMLAFLLGIGSAKFSATACRGFGYEIRKEEYQKIQSYSFKNLDEFRASSIITRLTNDVQILSDTLCNIWVFIKHTNDICSNIITRC